MKQIRSSKFSKIIAYYLAIMMFLQVTQPMQMYALTEGPTQPEFNSFTPIGTSDMVDLASGDFNYNIPIMDVGGYPLNLAYNSGVTMDQEASWVGLGWNLNVGQINRQMRGLPDDFNGDPMTYENNMKDNVTVGGNVGINIALFGVGEDNEPPSLDLSVGIGIKYNNYNGLTASATGGLSYDVSESLSVGLQLESSASEGVSVSPSASFSSKLGEGNLSNYNLGASAGVSYNSRKGIESMTFSPSIKKSISTSWQQGVKNSSHNNQIGIGATLSYNPDASYTPTKRVGMKSSNYMFNMNLGGEVWGFEPGVKFSGFRTSQGIDDSEKYKVEKGFGYENSYNASVYDVLDFNREKDRTVSRNTNILPVTNYTYDIYSIQGQGVSGMFRPYQGQVGYVFDKYTIDKSNGGQLGVEIQVGGGNHWGFNGSVTNSNSSTGLWYSGNQALPRFLEEKNVKPDYEKVYFKNVGGTHVDKERTDLLTNQLGDYSAIKFSIQGGQLARATTPQYYKSNGDKILSTTKIKRDKRVNRNQVIQKLTRKEASRFGFSKSFSKYAKDHHTAEIQILKDGGERYVFGKPLYNVVKKEVTFDVSGGGDAVADCKTGLVPYSANSDNSLNNNRDGDQYFNRVTTPAYAHTYLLTYVLSPDYQDLPGENFGRVSDDDLGSYTKFTYKDVSKKEDGSSNLYRWRVPFAENKANYDEGLKSSEKDNKGNYQYGEKEMSYIEKIETKTHVAIFEISERKDGYGVKGENGGLGLNSKSYKLNKIELYAKPEYEAFGDNAKPIKTAHFIYDYSLCLGIDNNNNGNIDDYEIDNQGGKLTLQKVYFTYRDSNMGKYTPYEFSYKKSYIKKIDNTTTEEVPFNYDMKGYDVWGNFKPTLENATCAATVGGMTNAEYPFVDQSNRELADQYTSAWQLNTVKLPSGGIIEVDYESDDYAYVQDKEVMQMFKVIGAANNKNGDNVSNYLYNAIGHSEYIYIKLDKPVSQTEFRNKYIRNLISEPVYFRFLLNMFDPNPLPGADTTDKYDYVTGYLELANDFKIMDNGDVVAIKIKTVNKGDGVNKNKQVNPIAKAGWNFGRSYLNRLVFGINNSEDTNDLEGMVMELAMAVPSLIQVFKSPNGRLEQKRIASMFVANKSWIRLMQPESKKIGGGSRVKEIKLHDEWDMMTDHQGDENYKQFYGQQYSYNLDNNENTTSGVATYEPLGCKENPLVMPFYDHNNKGLLLGPDEQNYVEKPLGESFYPSPKITYSRVVVKNLPRVKEENGEIIKVKKHATGHVVTEFFTSKDYPTLVDVTPISSHYDKPPLASILNINAKDHLTLSQGFSVHTNDMDGKMKSQRVYAEGQTGFISGVDYKYSNNYTNIREKGLLNNAVTTIDSKGKVETNTVGVDYDVINDFRFNESITETPGVRFNTAGLPITVIYVIVPTPLPTYSRHENILKTAVTTKVIHSTGILRETIAYDLGSVVSTKNLAWDADTGQVLLTETVNEYNDNYFSFNFPAYWNADYLAMGQAITNLDLSWNLDMVSNGTYKFTPYNSIQYNARNYLLAGDELWITQDKRGAGFGYFEPLYGDRPRPFKAWVTNVDNNGNITLIDELGLRVDQYKLKKGSFKVIRSGYRNLQMASMASVTSMTNPLTTLVDGKLNPNLYQSTNWNDYKIINASAIEYSNKWAGQCECNLPEMIFDDNGNLVFEYEVIDYEDENTDFIGIMDKSFNPYVYNILGNWRAKTSYAYLTGRYTSENVTPRVAGFFNTFSPYYKLNSTNWKWGKNTAHLNEWTFASEVTQYSPYGQEVENKDALDRYSSALYGYNYRFPLAVASNTRYNELAYDGFEDYDFSECNKNTHFNFKDSLDTNNITVTGNHFHTGKKSLRVAPKDAETDGRKITIQKQMVSCNEVGESITLKKRKAKRTKK